MGLFLMSEVVGFSTSPGRVRICVAEVLNSPENVEHDTIIAVDIRCHYFSRKD
jgi:hypothetical protein